VTILLQFSANVNTAGWKGITPLIDAVVSAALWILVDLKGLQLRDSIACVLSLLLALAGSQRLLYRLFCRIQASSLWWLRLTGVLAVPGI